MLALQKTILLLFLFHTLLFSNELQKEYIVTHNYIELSDLIKNPKNNEILFNINPARHSKRVKASKILKRLQSYGYNNFHTKHAYIQFTQKSPINTQKLKNVLQNYYITHYKNISIEKISIKPIKYMTSLPKNYTVGFSRNAYLTNKGVLFIKTPEHKKYFFEYTLLAHVTLYQTTKEIQKGDTIALTNTQKKSIILDKLRAKPLMSLPRNKYQAKHRIQKEHILTQRDITGLYLIKRGTNVTLSLDNAGVEITLSAKALQNGRFGDTISFTHKNKKIRAIVTGRNRAKVQ